MSRHFGNSGLYGRMIGRLLSQSTSLTSGPILFNLKQNTVNAPGEAQLTLQKSSFSEEIKDEWLSLVSMETELNDVIADLEQLDLKELEKYQQDLNRYRSDLARYLLKSNSQTASVSGTIR